MSLLKHLPEISELIAENKSRRILDYGCGNAAQYLRERAHAVWGDDVPELYDSSVEEFQLLPSGQFDGVICVGLFDRLPEEDIPLAATQIAWYAKQWAFVAVTGVDRWREILEPFFKGGARLVLRETK